MIYIDSCIPMYLVGADHPNKSRVIELVNSLISANEVFVTSAETFQEILHRYRALHDMKNLKAAYSALEEMVTDVFDITKADTDNALHFAIEYSSLSSRDCLHSAIMKRKKCLKIWTYDKCFDEVSSFIRIF
ncbi:MAG: vapc13 [Bacteriovoracaceae bacterium]|nr:vapc13 [Bacteriovoracaceae bacterium]